MNEEFKNEEQATQDSGWIQGGSSEMGATQENTGFQSEFLSQDTDAPKTVVVPEAYLDKPVNMVTGIVGAFLGVLIGVVLWVIIYQMGYIAGLAGFVMMICAFKGFELLGGKMNIPGAVICIVMVLVAVYFAHNISIAISVMTEVDGYTFGTAYRFIPTFRNMSSEFDSAYIHDLVLGYVLTLVAIVPSIKSMISRK